jgi:hypothetical protein
MLVVHCTLALKCLTINDCTSLFTVTYLHHNEEMEEEGFMPWYFSDGGGSCKSWSWKWTA